MARMGLEKRDDPKRTIAFYDDHLEYLQYISGKNHMNVTQYINRLISQDMAQHDRAEWKATVEEKKAPSLDDIIKSATGRTQQTSENQPSFIRKGFERE